MSFKDRIRTARKNKKITQKELAEQLNMSHNAVSNWENGESQPDYNILCRICDILDVDPNYLLGYETKKEKENKNISEKTFDKTINFLISNKDILIK